MTCEKITFGDGWTAIVCSRGHRPRTWQCECGKRTPNAEQVCRHCGLYRDGCPRCDSDLVPAPGGYGLWGEPAPFVRGVKRVHRCNGNHAWDKKPCGYEVTA